MALKGITFPLQEVPSLATGAMQAAMWPDGRVLGCTVSASGSELILAAGELMAAGRLISNDAALSSGAIAATGGVARWVLRLDLSAASTEVLWAQATLRVDTAASVAELPALVRGDINAGTDKIYELELATAAMGASGVSSLLSALPSARRVIRMGTAVPTTADLADGEIYLQYAAD